MKFAVAAMAAGVLAVATAAEAADINLPVPVPVVVAPAAVPPAFDWSRFYVGVIGGAWLSLDGNEPDGRVAGVAGKGFVLGQGMYLGAEVQAGIYDFASPDFEIYGLARFGAAIGERALVYGLAGIGWDDDIDAAGGLGMEIALGDNLGLRADALFYWPLDGAGFIPTYVSLTGGITFRFGQ